MKMKTYPVLRTSMVKDITKDIMTEKMLPKNVLET